MPEQLDLFPELLPQQPTNDSITFTDFVIGCGVALVKYQRWSQYVGEEISRRVDRIEAEEASAR